MGKYSPLSERLRGRVGDSWTARFAEVEAVLGFSLPASARTYREWWANQKSGGHSHTKGWQDAGWHVWKVDLSGETVTFRRVEAREIDGADETEDRLIERAGKILGISDRRQVIRQALEALIQREAARHLIAMGGTMPDFQAPPRRRPAI